MKKITLLIVFIFLSLLGFSQTVYQLDHTHKYIWQGGDWFRNIEEYYVYDNDGTKETDILNKTSINGTDFTNNFKHTKDYNSNNFILEDFKEVWNGIVWGSDTKRTKTYDGSGRVLSDLKEKNNGSGLEYDTKSDYTYDDVENKSEILFYDKYEAGAWLLYKQTFDALTPTGYEREKWVRSFISGVLEPDSKTLTTITNNQYLGEINQSWDDALMVPSWVNSEKLELSYTMDDQWDKFEYFYWNTFTDDWEPEPYTRTTYIRDDATYDLIILIEDNDEIDGWISSSRLLYIRDGNNNLLTSTVQLWDDSVIPEDWSVFSVATYEYDINNNNTKITSQRDIGVGLVNSSRTDKFWVEGTALNVTFNSLISAHPYPNPTTDVINIKFKSPITFSSEVKLYDIQGKLVYNSMIKKGSSTFQIPIAYQTNGIYMLHLKTNESTEIYKIIKK